MVSQKFETSSNYVKGKKIKTSYNEIITPKIYFSKTRDMERAPYKNNTFQYP